MKRRAQQKGDMQTKLKGVPNALFKFVPLVDDNRASKGGKKYCNYFKASLDCSNDCALCQVQCFASFSDFFTSPFTLEERYLMKKADCHLEVTNLRGKLLSS